MDDEATYPPIADYALIGDMHSCALVSKAGSVDWACFPRFDSPSTFARILDMKQGGYFQLAPADVRSVSRRYLPNTNVLETTFDTETGTAVLTDFMPIGAGSSIDEPREVSAPGQIARIIRCTSGEVTLRLECHPRFDYATIVPQAELLGEHRGFAHGGHAAFGLFSSIRFEPIEGGFRGEAHLGTGDEACAVATFVTRMHHETEPTAAHEVGAALDATVQFWESWCERITYRGDYRQEVVRSALALKALSYAPTGALLAAPTTSLPEAIGGVRNWDYRYTWIRDAAFAVYALSSVGLHREAFHFQDWIEWSTAGQAADVQVMYGLGGERWLPERTLDHLEGYRRSAPVRVGNAASDDFQLDIYGELMDSIHLYRSVGGEITPPQWNFMRKIVAFVIEHWREPDEGIWEVRGGRQHFVFSKAMCWVALDRVIRAGEDLDLDGDLDAWRAARDEIHDDVMARGYDEERGAFVQAYGSKALDASVLLLPLFGFIKFEDPRMRSTVEAIERELTTPEGYVHRYLTEDDDHHRTDDGLPGGEGTFNICTFWLIHHWIAVGELDPARELFERLCGRANDVGLLSEESDSSSGEMLGNFPQAFSHLGLINAAVQFERAKQRERRGEPAKAAAGR